MTFSDFLIKPTSDLFAYKENLGLLIVIQLSSEAKCPSSLMRLWSLMCLLARVVLISLHQMANCGSLARQIFSLITLRNRFDLQVGSATGLINFCDSVFTTFFTFTEVCDSTICSACRPVYRSGQDGCPLKCLTSSPYEKRAYTMEDMVVKI